jgi:ketosteroid isomerase-like protein
VDFDVAFIKAPAFVSDIGIPDDWKRRQADVKTCVDLELRWGRRRHRRQWLEASKSGMMPSTTDDIVSGITAKWAASFHKLDAEALASLYSKHAFFFGSNPNLYRGRDGVTAYFNGLPRWKSPTAEFLDVVTAPVGADVINVAGTVSFVFDERALSVKITWVVAREDGEWKIISHHVSPVAPLI